MPIGSVPAAEQPPAGPESGPTRLALLVGIQTYPNLGPSEQLEGARNDVQAMRTLLVERFGFQEKDIVTLTDEAATGAAIRRELGKLVQRVRLLPAESPPAQVVFCFSGHGSQIPDQEEGHPDCDEEDGLDETLVPYDAEKQAGDRDIRDDERYEFAKSICAGGRARLWVVLDCCHSGTSVRGSTKIRKLDRRLPRTLGSSDRPRKIALKSLPPGTVALSACRDCEVEPEYQQGGESYGLLTRFLVQVLSEERSVSKLSHDLLRQALITRYHQDPSVVQAPTPQLEAGEARALQNTVLGGCGADRPPYWKAVANPRDPSSVRLGAGAFHGVTVGSLYELYERPEEIVWEADAAGSSPAAKSLAWLRVERVEGASAEARAFQWDDAERNAEVEIALPRDFKQGYAVERYHDHGGFGVRLRVVRAVDQDTDGPPLGPGDEEVPAVVRDGLAAIRKPGESEWLKWVEGDEPCDLLLRIDGHYAALFPATGMSAVPGDELKTRGSTVPGSLGGGWGPIDLRVPEDAAQDLGEFLRQITRARNLIRLATAQSDAGGSPIRVALELVALEVNEDNEVLGSKPWKRGSDGALVMREGDYYALRVANLEESDKPIYVSILAVNSNMEIDQVLPYVHEGQLYGSQRLEQKTDRESDGFVCEGGLGQRWAIVLATREPNDFYLFDQPALPRIKGTTRGSESSLRELLLQQTYFKTRGDPRVRPQKLFDESWSAATLRWDALP